MAIIDLTTTERCEALAGVGTADVSTTAAFAALVTSVSARIERYLNRPIEAVARTEYLDVVPDRFSYQLGANPVASIASVKNSASFAWADVTSKVEGTDYVLDPASGIIRQLTYWTAGAEALQVVYTAGLAANTAAVLASYPDLADACEKQVVEEYNRRGSMLRKSANVGGATETSESMTLLPIVREILAPYRRPSW